MPNAHDQVSAFGDLLRAYRIAARLTQEELAERSRLSVRAIADMERGRTVRPRTASVRQIGVALELSGSALTRLRQAARGVREDDAQAADWVTPWQMPAAVQHFTGRTSELAAMDSLVRGARRTGAVTIAITGGAGVGKTALALHWAHLHRAHLTGAHLTGERFPDGHLFADLCGFDPANQARTAQDVLRDFLEALGVPAGQVPASFEARAGMYRSLLASRQMLVILDNARDPAQVRPLLPGTPQSLTLVTSRRKLTSLVARDGAEPVYLDALTGPDAVALLASRLGEARLNGQEEAAGRLADMCCRLPLALNIAAASIITSPSRSVASLTAELTESGRPLDELDAGDPSGSIRPVFGASYRMLTAPAARMFRLLGVTVGPDISWPAAAALLGAPAEQTRGLLGELTDMHLLTESGQGRFALHDLLRAFAIERLAAEETDQDRETATRRLLEWYQRTANAAGRIINSRRRFVTLDDPLPGTEPLSLSGYDQAVAWLCTERVNLLAAVGQAGAHGYDEIAWKLPLALWDLFALRGLVDDWVASHLIALPSARRLQEVVGQSWLLNNLCGAFMLQGRLEEADACAAEGLDLCDKWDEREGEASLLHNRALVQLKMDELETAMDLLVAALGRYRAAANVDGEGHIRQTMAEVHLKAGDPAAAVASLNLALMAFRSSGNRFSEALALIDLGEAYQALGRYDQAIRAAVRAAGLSKQVGHLPGQAQALMLAGQLLQETGQHEAAVRRWRRAAAIFAELGDPRASELAARSS